MAGSSTNWFKVGGKGASAKGYVYVSNATLQSHFGKTADLKKLKAKLANDDFYQQTVQGLATMSPQPNGQAKSAATPPSNWADDPLAQQLILDQQPTSNGKSGMVQSGSPAEQAILKAFAELNPTAYRDPSDNPVSANAPPGYDWLVRYQASAEIINKAMLQSL
jgi:hypothetical protein